MLGIGRVGRSPAKQEVSLPLYDGADSKIRANLERLATGERVSLIAIGFFTDGQFEAVNAGRIALDLPVLEQNEIVFIGRHIFRSRTNDGYTVEDIIDQISSCLASTSVVNISNHWSRIESSTKRCDKYGNEVIDWGIFEMTARKPRAELFSVIPKGDINKPNKI